MSTTVYTRSVNRAARLLREGGVVAFPTETVYGLGAHALDEKAVRRIFRAKGRPADNPLIVHLASPDRIGEVARRIPASAERLIEAFLPGPLSLVLPRAQRVPDVVTAGLDTVAVRVPAHATARLLLQAASVPVAAPSANRSGRPSPTTWQAVRDDLDGRIDAVLTAGAIEHGLESTVVDCTSRTPVVLRSGSMDLEKLREVVPGIRLPESADERLARSPGTRYRHYAPHAQVLVVDNPGAVPVDLTTGAAFLGLTRPPARCGFASIHVYGNVEAYARDLYHRFRAADADGIDRIVCQTVPPTGRGLALGDRLARAAAGHPIPASGSGKSPG